MGCTTSKSTVVSSAETLFPPLSEDELVGIVAVRLAARHAEMESLLTKEQKEEYLIKNCNVTHPEAQLLSQNKQWSKMVSQVSFWKTALENIATSNHNSTCAATNENVSKGEYHFDQPRTVDAPNGHFPPHVSRVPKVEQQDTVDHIEQLFTKTLKTRMQIRLHGPSSIEPPSPRLMPDDLNALATAFDGWHQFYSHEKIDLQQPLPSISNRWIADEEFGRQRIDGVHPTLIEKIRDVEFFTTVPRASGIMEELCNEDEVGNPSSLLLNRVLEETDEVMNAQQQLSKAIAQGRLFVCDYSFLVGLPAPPANNLCAPLVVLGVSTDSNALLPLAIKLHPQSPPKTENDAPCPVFTPINCSKETWLLCKLHVQVSEAFSMEVKNHLLNTHLMSEAIYLSLMDTLPVDHAIRTVMQPHFRRTMAINWWARKDLVANGKAVPRLMVGGPEGMVALLRNSLNSFSYKTNMDFRGEAIRRGVVDVDNESFVVSSTLPRSLFLEDALELLDGMMVYFDDVVSILYNSDEQVSADSALQEWILGISTAEKMESEGNQPPNHQRLHIADLPLTQDLQSGKFTLSTRAELSQFLANVVFNATVLHSAFQNSQWEYMGFVPNMPGKLSLPPPTSTSDEYSVADLVAALPQADDSGDQVAVVRSLSLPPKVSLGTFTEADGFWQQAASDTEEKNALVEAIVLARRKWQQSIEDVAAKITTRSTTSTALPSKDENVIFDNVVCRQQQVPYTALHPSVVGMSVDL